MFLEVKDNSDWTTVDWRDFVV